MLKTLNLSFQKGNLAFGDVNESNEILGDI